MKVFNQGGRTYTHHELAIRPGVFTPIPEQHQAAVKKLLEKYSHELVSAEDHSARAGRLAQTVTDLQGQVEELKAKLLEANGTDGEGKTENARLAEVLAETEKRLQECGQNLRLAGDRNGELLAAVKTKDDLIKSLEVELANAKKENELLTGTLEAATKPTS